MYVRPAWGAHDEAEVQAEADNESSIWNSEAGVSGDDAQHFAASEWVIRLKSGNMRPTHVRPLFPTPGHAWSSRRQRQNSIVSSLDPLVGRGGN